jgi:hypothetical protein
VLDQRLLSIYLNDHLAGSVVGAQLVRRAAQSNEKTSYGESLARLAQEISEDREALEELMRRPRRQPAAGDRAPAHPGGARGPAERRLTGYRRSRRFTVEPALDA